MCATDLMVIWGDLEGHENTGQIEADLNAALLAISRYEEAHRISHTVKVEA